MNTLQGAYPEWLDSILTALIHGVGQLMGQDWQVVLPPVVLLLIWAVILFTMIAIVAQASVIFMVLMERKVLAWLTQRKGPNRVGPWGLLQTLADGVKLLFKEDIMTPQQDKFLFTLAPAVFFLPTFVFFALIPFTDRLLGVDLPAGALFIFALSSISVLGIVLAGWASNNKYSLLGGMRSAAQAISYEIPLVMSVLAVVLFAGTMNIQDIVEAQKGPLWNWFWLVVTPISFLIFFVSSIAEVNRIPFDLPEAESELVSGYNTEYTGMKFALFFLAEYTALFAMSGLTVAFFFGGYLSPLGFYFADTALLANMPAAIGELVRQVEMLFWFMIKTYAFIFVAMWWRATLPRLKPDQLMGFSWKFLIPLSLLNIVLIAVGKYMLLKNAPYVFDFSTPILSGGPVVQTWLLWVVLAVVAFGGYFYLMSRLLSEKLEARLTR